MNNFVGYSSFVGLIVLKDLNNKDMKIFLLWERFLVNCYVIVFFVHFLLWRTLLFLRFGSAKEGVFCYQQQHQDSRSVCRQMWTAGLWCLWGWMLLVILLSRLTQNVLLFVIGIAYTYFLFSTYIAMFVCKYGFFTKRKYVICVCT